MRAYFFGNMYLSSIQQGIQAAHVISDIMLKYVTISEGYEIDSNSKRIMAWDWAQNHKTMVLLNGGYSATIRELRDFFDDSENPYPWDDFNEGEDALDGALTSVGIVLPEKIYETAKLISDPLISNMIRIYGTIEITTDPENPVEYEFSKWEYQLLQKLNTFQLAK